MISATNGPSFSAILSSGTAVSVLPAAGLGVLATFVIDDFGITRGQFGLMTAATSVVAALVSPVMGHLTDRFGGKRSLLGVFALAAIGIIGIALTPIFSLVFVASIASGFSVAWANPATNRLLTSRIPAGRRGVTTGVKQSGEMVAFVLCGAALPAAAIRWGWRPAFGLLSLMPAVSLAWAALYLPEGRTELLSKQLQTDPPPPVRKDVWWLSVYSFLMGLGCGSIVAYLALFAHEGAGLGVASAGLVVLVAALVAIVFRILWSHLTERASAYRRSFGIMAFLTALSAILLWCAGFIWDGFIWLGAIGFGATGLSFAALGMLASMAASHDETTGRDTGLVNLGFSSGITIGPPIFGLAIDLTGAYSLSFLWVTSALVAASIVVAIWRWHVKDRF